ncbi:MAG TPA: citrate/2-methylcitrate synthase, partial [Longimicrobiales bacterium]|nr:citrate/2-methylcitrate synthase [Longimicrobiales bacterium]
MSNRGLEGVVVAQSTISKVFGEEGRLVYRGYEIEDLAENASFEEVCHLLWHGELPDGAALDELRSALVAERALPSQVIDILRALPASTHPMAALRTAVSALAGFDEEADDLSRESNLRKAIRLTARMPT